MSILDTIKAAETPRALESVFQKFLKEKPTAGQRRKHKAARKEILLAIEKRGWELVYDSHLRHKIPTITQKGNRLFATLSGSSYKTGRWGNAAGYSYGLHNLSLWVKKHGKYRSHSKVDSIIHCVLYGMPHRAVQRLYK